MPNTPKFPGADRRPAQRRLLWTSAKPRLEREAWRDTGRKGGRPPLFPGRTGGR